MYRGITRVACTALLLMLSASCQTADRAQKLGPDNQFTLGSTSDKRTALPEAASQRSVSVAVERLNVQVEKNPSDVKALLNLAQLHLMRHDYDKAEAVCQQALRVDLKNNEARKILAQVALRRGNVDMASIILNGIGGARSKDSSVLNMMAMIALKRDENGEAMGLFKRALELNPGDVAVRMNLGVLYVKYRLMGAAAVQFERVLKSEPDHQDAKLHLAIVKSSQGNNKEARKIYKDLLSEKRRNPLALYNLAVVEKNLQRYDDAIDNLKTYLKTEHARTSDTSVVFALLEEINKEKMARGQATSDEEIQALAAKAASAPQSARPKASAGRTGRPTSGTVQPTAAAVETDDEISSLERALD